MVVFVPTEAFWQIARSQRILKAASFWRFFRLHPWGPDYRRAWELQCSLERDGLATITEFDGHPVQFTLTCQMIREVLHTGGALLPEGNLALYEKKMVTS